jgi:Tat protein secretion system quality control protein TatD with DNase activity
LDHRTEDPENWADQMLTVDRILNYLLPEHVLVLHCRSVSKMADEAILSMLHLLTAHPSVNRGQLTNLHCLSGSPAILQKWIGTFLNSYVGFTAISCGSGKYQETIRLVEPSRLLLENDALQF